MRLAQATVRDAIAIKAREAYDSRSLGTIEA